MLCRAIITDLDYGYRPCSPGAARSVRFATGKDQAGAGEQRQVHVTGVVVDLGTIGLDAGAGDSLLPVS